jgi:hypothetical protein
MIGAMFIGALIVRIIIGDWQLTDALVQLVMLVLFPFFEWIAHVFILHWRPKRFGRLTADRVLGTYPDLATVETSPTAKNLHAIAER